MNREEMLARLERGEDPLHLSLDKWYDLFCHLISIHSISEYDPSLQDDSLNCALCEVHKSCRGCPIARYTNALFCRGTPFSDFQLAYTHRNLNEMRAAALAEINFLLFIEYLRHHPFRRFLYRLKRFVRRLGFRNIKEFIFAFFI